MDAFALDAEYMTALDEFAATELATGGVGSEPAVWNISMTNLRLRILMEEMTETW